MRRLVLLVTFAVIGSLFAPPAPAGASGARGASLQPPQVRFRGNIATVTTRPVEVLHLDPGSLVGDPDVTGDENRSFDVQYVRVDMRTPNRPAWQTLALATTDRRRDLRIGSGQVVCVRARQHSYDFTSAWTDPVCVTRARDDEDLRRTGHVGTVADHRYADGRAMVLRSGPRVLLGRIPRGALFGRVFSDVDGPPDGYVCPSPNWRIRGQREPNSAFGVAAGRRVYLVHRARARGTMVMTVSFGRTCPIGGFVVVPRWVPR